MSAALLVGLAQPLAAQDATFRELLGSATASLAAGDTAEYLAQMIEAEGVLEPGHLNRPFAQYHVARGAAMLGDTALAVAALDRMLTEDIEALMIVYCAFDPAFDVLKGSPAYQDLMDRARATKITATLLRDRVWLLEGAGSQLVAFIGPEGVLLVDTGYSLAAPGIERALKDAAGEKVTVRYIVNTHFHEDHVGGNANLGYYATIIAHPNTRRALTEEQEFMPGVVIPPRGGAALPRLVSAEPLDLYFNGDTVSVIPLRGHTDADVIVYFAGARVLHMGDRFFPDNMEFVYPSADVDRFMATMDALLARIPDDGLVVSGHAGVVPIERLRTAYQGTAQMIEFVRAGRESGKSAGQLAGEAEERGYPARWIRGLYQALGEGD